MFVLAHNCPLSFRYTITDINYSLKVEKNAEMYFLNLFLRKERKTMF